jgi:hypothetical protein
VGQALKPGYPVSVLVSPSDEQGQGHGPKAVSTQRGLESSCL